MGGGYLLPVELDQPITLAGAIMPPDLTKAATLCSSRHYLIDL